MKKIVLILAALILFGFGLGIQFFTQNEKLDQTVFQQTTMSIGNLQTIDKSLLLLLKESRFDSEFDHSQIFELNYQISEEFDNLRYDALFEEIEKSADLSIAVNAFKTQFELREELLENYEQGNIAISESLIHISNLAAKLKTIDEIASKTELAKLFVLNETQLFGLALGRGVDLDLSEITLHDDFTTPVKTQLSEYNDTIKIIAESSPTTSAAYRELNALPTSKLLDTIEQHYVSYHNQAIEASNRLRNALIAYGALLLTALVFFGLQIRKNVLSLEQQVADRTEEIRTAYDDLQESQEQLIQSEKMASLGQMVAGVAHEINTPLGYVSSNIETLTLNLEDITLMMKKVSLLMAEVQNANRDKRDITAHLMQAVKSYNEIDISDLLDESTQLLADGTYGLTEISKLVVSLKDFARLDRLNAEEIDLRDCIESSLTIASNHIRENNVRVIRDFSELPLINCFPSKLNQLFLNIITNACQSMSEHGGDMSVKTTSIDGSIHIDFSDQGIGMSEQTKQRIFDPFFTTKNIGDGTGLGLSIAYKIVTAHNGSLEVVTKLGQGTTFSVILPTNNQL